MAYFPFMFPGIRYHNVLVGRYLNSNIGKASKNLVFIHDGTGGKHEDYLWKL